jgi:sortase A
MESAARSQDPVFWKLAVRCFECGCWLAGGLAIAWFVVISASTWMFQVSQAKRLESLRPSPDSARKLRIGDTFGTISVPRIGLSAVVMEGDDDATLRHAIGHIPGTSDATDRGNVGLAGHRDTFFRGLGQLQSKDLIVLNAPSGQYRYEVVGTKIVGPQQVEVLRSSGQSELTLVTCFPFHYIGPAPKRFIVEAMRVPDGRDEP